MSIHLGFEHILILVLNTSSSPTCDHLLLLLLYCVYSLVPFFSPVGQPPPLSSYMSSWPPPLGNPKPKLGASPAITADW
jgi:hypothetical protein